MKHASGRVTSAIESNSGHADGNGLPRILPERKWSSAIRESDVDYGPHFHGIDGIRTTSKAPVLASACIQN